MERGKEYVVPFLVITFVLTVATTVAGWPGFYIALAALVLGGLVGAYMFALEVRREVERVTEEYDEKPFPYL